MNWPVNFSIINFSMSYECCQSFRAFPIKGILVDFIASKKIIPLPVVDLDELSRRVIHQTRLFLWLRRMSFLNVWCYCVWLLNPPSQRFGEGHLGHASGTRSVSRRRKNLYLNSILFKTTYDSDLMDERSWCVHESILQIQNLGDHEVTKTLCMILSFLQNHHPRREWFGHIVQ